MAVRNGTVRREAGRLAGGGAGKRRSAPAGGGEAKLAENGRDRDFGWAGPVVEVWRKPTTVPCSARMAEVCLRFGISPQAEPLCIVRDLKLAVGPGQIVLLVGPSGVGKTSVLEHLSRLSGSGGGDGVGGKGWRRAVDVGRVRMPGGRAIVDIVASDLGLGESLAVMTSCGLGEPRLWVRQYSELSDGERFRARLARAIGKAGVKSGSVLLCDEFCAVLHRRAAWAISFNLRKLLSRRLAESASGAPAMVAACTHEDIVEDLQPDVTVRLMGGGRYVVQEGRVKGRSISFLRRLRIERGCKADYEGFAEMHYRSTDELGFVDRVFVLRDGVGGEALGVVVYAHGPLELSLRNEATGGRFTRNPQRLNREVRILRRLVIHPDVRGCGLGHWLVSQTLRMVGVPFVECLANMGSVNPVFERAGMERIGQCAVPAGRAQLWRELRRLKVDPLGTDLVDQVKRRPVVRRLARRVIADWLRATTAGGERRVVRWGCEAVAVMFRQVVGSRPVYYLWRR
jgi:ABC-type lipoprotein export system ATPase subunit/GNAT superfamily N-acetyltransferase